MKKLSWITRFTVNTVPTYCKSGNFREGFIFAKRSFVKLKPSRRGKITLSFTDIGISCPSRDFITSQICLLMLFAKIKFSRKFPNLQYAYFNAHCVRMNLEHTYKLNTTSLPPKASRTHPRHFCLSLNAMENSADNEQPTCKLFVPY